MRFITNRKYNIYPGEVLKPWDGFIFSTPLYRSNIHLRVEGRDRVGVYSVREGIIRPIVQTHGLWFEVSKDKENPMKVYKDLPLIRVIKNGLLMYTYRSRVYELDNKYITFTSGGIPYKVSKVRIKVLLGHKDSWKQDEPFFPTDLIIPYKEEAKKLPNYVNINPYNGLNLKKLNPTFIGEEYRAKIWKSGPKYYIIKGTKEVEIFHRKIEGIWFWIEPKAGIPLGTFNMSYSESELELYKKLFEEEPMELFQKGAKVRAYEEHVTRNGTKKIPVYYKANIYYNGKYIAWKDGLPYFVKMYSTNNPSQGWVEDGRNECCPQAEPKEEIVERSELMADKFWMVIHKSTCSPEDSKQQPAGRRYSTQKEAEDIAKGMCQTRGTEMIVLQAISSFARSQPPVERTDL